MRQSRETIKKYFETKDTPTQGQFADFVDSVPNILDDGFNIIIYPKGNWTLGVSYIYGDIVYLNGSTYYCLLANIADNTNTPPGYPDEQNTYWKVLAKKGDNGTPGLDGQQIELQKTAAYLQWRLSGGAWNNLIAISELKGDKGDSSDMFKSVYDPNNKNSDAFSMDSMVETSTKKILTSAERTNLANQSGTNSGDETTSTIKTKLGISTLSGANTGDQTLSSLGGVASNTAITGATKTKITYDAKGLVTAGADATTADIADSTDKRYCTDAQKTVIGNTSGTNSGNETTTTIGALINGATAKTTPVDADMVGLMDSAASNVVKKLSWSNIKSTLKTYLDTLYQTVLVSGTNIKTVNSNSLLGSGDIVVTGSMTYPGSGIPNSTGSAWGTSYTTTGSGTVVPLATSPSFTTPSLGAALATTINGLALSLGNTSSSTTNVAVGYQASILQTTGSGNTAVGSGALQLNILGASNTALGFSALRSSTGYYNTAVGDSALYSTTGSYNIGVGRNAGKYETGSGAFYVDAYDRTNTAGDKAGAILYGLMSTTPGSQSLITNSAFSATYGMNVPTGQTYKINGTALAAGDIGALPSASFTDSAVTGKLITGFVSGAGTVAATDTILQAINKINGNDANKLSTSAFTDSAVTSKLITGFTSGAGTVSATDTILQAINKIVGNIALKLTANTAITAATKTKITYDVNGLVTAGADMQESDLTFTDVTTNNVSTSKHGFVPKAPNVTTQFLRGDGTWAVPTGGVGDHSCSVYNNSQLTISTTATAIAFDSEDFDTDTMHDNSTNKSRITVPSAGKYLVTFNPQMITNGYYADFDLYKNGVYFMRGCEVNRYSSCGSNTSSFSLIVSLAANDYLEIYGTANSSVTLNSSKFSLIKLA